MVCTNCGKANSEKAKFCSGCGSPLEKTLPAEEISADVKAPETEEMPEIQETAEIPRKEEDTKKMQDHSRNDMGNPPVSMGWIALSKISMVLICIAFTFIGMLIFLVWFNDETAAIFGTVIGFGIGIGWVLIQALITAICQNIYISVENMNILIEKIQTLSEDLVMHTSSSDLDRNILIEKVQDLTKQIENKKTSGTKEDI